MKLKNIAAATAAMAVAWTISAQQPLTKEIVVTRDVDPVERAATRPAIAPAIVAPRMQLKKLEPGEYTAYGTLRPVVATLEAAAWNDTLPVSPYRGYAAVGYFPAFNLGASAGYDFLHTRRHSAGVWLQYNGNSYNQQAYKIAGGEKGTKVSNRQQTFRLGLDGDFNFKAGTLSASAGVMMGSRRLPNIAEDYDQTAWGLGVGADWQGKIGRANLYHAGANIGHFGYDKYAPEAKMEQFLDGTVSAKEASKPLSELTFGFSLGYERLWKHHSWGLDIEGQLQDISATGMFWPGELEEDKPYSSPLAYPATVYYRGDGDTRGYVAIKPHYKLNLQNLKLLAGLDIPLGIGYDGDDYIIPDIRLDFTPSGVFGVWAQAKGFYLNNTLSQMYGINPYLLGNVSYRHTAVADYSLGINIGPFKGFTAELWGGYSTTDYWLGNAIVYAGNTMGKSLAPGTEDYAQARAFDIMDIRDCKGVFGGVRLSYLYRDIVKVSVSAEMAAHDAADGGYYLWRDRAKCVFGANISVRPIKALEIGVDWQLRTDRMANAYFATNSNLGDMFGWSYWNRQDFELGDANMLGVKATYRLTDAFTIFLNVENLLGKKWQITPQITSDGNVHGLAGVSLRF